MGLISTFGIFLKMRYWRLDRQTGGGRHRLRREPWPRDRGGQEWQAGIGEGLRLRRSRGASSGLEQQRFPRRFRDQAIHRGGAAVAGGGGKDIPARQTVEVLSEFSACQ